MVDHNFLRIYMADYVKSNKFVPILHLVKCLLLQ